MYDDIVYIIMRTTTYTKMMPPRAPYHAKSIVYNVNLSTNQAQGHS